MAAGAFFEEAVYRQFVPETLNSLFKKWKIPVEIFSVVIFALAHRYLGWISVFNAAFCGAVLRLCRIKKRLQLRLLFFGSFYIQSFRLLYFPCCCRNFIIIDII
ncbi:MAG: CPBP family intramembrane metalloprotease [Treponema succinifaciens]|nr:MAG: CPBP family intramembrane metalloprotease [Treponema succinifaciens]